MKKLLSEFRNVYWYVPIGMVIILGIVLGGFLWYGTEFLGLSAHLSCTPDKKDSTGTRLLGLYGLGMVGGSMSSAIFFGKDANRQLYGGTQPPNFIDPIGYAMWIIISGFAGLGLYFAIKAGFLFIFENSAQQQMVSEAAWLIALSGGFASKRVTAYFAELVNRIVANNDQQPHANSKPSQVRKVKKRVGGRPSQH